MTINSQTRTAGPFAGTGTIVPYPFTFKVFQASDLQVVLTSAGLTQTTLTLSSDYTVTLNANQNMAPGGTITPLVAVAVGTTLSATSRLPIVQPASLTNSGGFYPAVIEDALDRLTILMQEQGFVSGPQTLRVPELGGVPLLPIAAARANYLLGFDSNGNPIAVAPVSGSAAALAADLANNTNAAKGSALVGYLPAGAGAVGRNNQEKLRESVSVFDFMTAAEVADVKARTQLLNVKAAINAAFASSKSIHFPAGAYWCGTTSGGKPIFDWRNAGSDINLTTDGAVKIVAKTDSVSVGAFFLFKHSNHVTIGSFQFQDLGFTTGDIVRGLDCFSFEHGNANSGNIYIESIYAKDVHAAFSVYNVGNTDIPSNRLRGITINHVFVDNGAYGALFADNGDGVQINNLVTFSVYRSYFVYGCTGHDVNIFARANLSTSGAVNISRQVSGMPTTGIKVRYVSRDVTTLLNHVLINHIDMTASGEINGIVLDLDIVDANVNNPAVRFVTYTASGGVETATPTNNIVNNVSIYGKSNNFSNQVVNTAVYNTKYTLNVDTNGFIVNANTYEQFKLSNDLSYVPTWASSGTQPVLGNGTLIGKYVVKAGLCFVSISLNLGSTTTYGTGTYSFTLPITPKVTSYGAARMLSSGTAWFLGTATASTGAQAVDVTTDNAGNQISPTIPFTWKSGDTLSLSVVYPV